MNLNQVTLPVDNMARATAFYRRLGFLYIVDTPLSGGRAPSGPPTVRGRAASSSCSL